MNPRDFQSSMLPRRRFIKTTAVTTAAFMAAPFVQASSSKRTLRTALIGTGWWGKNILKEAIASKRCKIIPLSDVDASVLEVAADQVNDLTGDTPKTYRDFRELLTKEKPEI